MRNLTPATFAAMLPLVFAPSSQAEVKASPENAQKLGEICLQSFAMKGNGGELCYYRLHPIKVWRQPAGKAVNTSLPQFCLTYTAFFGIPDAAYEKTYCLSHTQPLSPHIQENLALKDIEIPEGIITENQPVADVTDTNIITRVEKYHREERLIQDTYKCVYSISEGPTPDNVISYPRVTTPENDCRDVEILMIEDEMQGDEPSTCIEFKRPGAPMEEALGHCFVGKGNRPDAMSVHLKKVKKYLESHER